MIRLKHPVTNAVKECTTGYSWTTFFFGMFVPLIRGDIKWAAILLMLTLLVGFITAGVGCWVVDAIFAGFYNKIFIIEMVEKGYTGKDTIDTEWLVDNKVIGKK